MKNVPVRLKFAATILGDLLHQAGPGADMKAEAARALAAADALIEAAGFDATAAEADAEALAAFTREVVANARPVIASAFASMAAPSAPGTTVIPPPQSRPRASRKRT